MKNILLIDLDEKAEKGYAELLRKQGYVIMHETGRTFSTARTMERLSADMLIVQCLSVDREVEQRLEEIKRVATEKPLLLLTDNLSVETYIRTQALGVHDHICMPVSDHEIVRTVQKILAAPASSTRQTSDRNIGSI